jgi:hypothetical protein
VWKRQTVDTPKLVAERRAHPSGLPPTSKHGPKAIAELARLAKHALSEQARVTACRDLLDRAYGKASQALQSQVEVGASSELRRIPQQCDGQSRGLPPGENGTLDRLRLTVEQRMLGDAHGRDDENDRPNHPD